MNTRPAPNNDIKIVKHMYPGHMPSYELQVYSELNKKWYAMHYSSKLSDCQTYYDVIGDIRIEECIHNS